MLIRTDGEPCLCTVPWLADPGQSDPFSRLRRQDSAATVADKFWTWWEKRQDWLQEASDPARATEILIGTLDHERETRAWKMSAPDSHFYDNLLALCCACGWREQAQHWLDEFVEVHLCRAVKSIPARLLGAPNAALRLSSVLAWAEGTLSLEIRRGDEVRQWIRECAAENPEYSEEWGLYGREARLRVRPEVRSCRALWGVENG